jgi:hypothetical protein
MTRNRKLIAELRTRQPHETKARTNRPTEKAEKSAAPTRRDVHRPPRRTARSRAGHGDLLKAPAPQQSAAQETPPQPAYVPETSQVAPLAFVVIAYAAMAAFFVQLLIGS